MFFFVASRRGVPLSPPLSLLRPNPVIPVQFFSSHPFAHTPVVQCRFLYSCSARRPCFGSHPFAKQLCRAREQREKQWSAIDSKRARSQHVYRKPSPRFYTSRTGSSSPLDPPTGLPLLASSNHPPMIPHVSLPRLYIPSLLSVNISARIYVQHSFPNLTRGRLTDVRLDLVGRAVVLVGREGGAERGAGDEDEGARGGGVEFGVGEEGVEAANEARSASQRHRDRE